ncbi:efflux RND transporter periplasmic adaptor subunit [Bradyrhizobium sp.]|jgi:RND family efflux transporter MFP subunit|uniref:efflux RND transporter periplasmic adaptor subunit n=1 Tax=Bradyrhizobium sp. TaxID=376 RepID=UPI003C188FD9
MNKIEKMPVTEPPDETAPKAHDKPAGPSAVPPPPSKWLFAAVLVVVALVLGYGALGHWRTDAAAAETQREAIDFVPAVRTTTVKVLSDPIETTLPGQTDAFDRANIFARATGYVAERMVDIGSSVKKGDVLARIAAPDLDRQLDQAVAQLGQVQAALAQAQAQVSLAEANLRLGKSNFARSDDLVKKGFDTFQNHDTQEANVSTQQANLDAAHAGVKLAEANIQAQEATVNRLRTLAEFERVRAPFDGVVTVRNVDIGDLVNADTGGGTPMFTMVRDDVLRVSVNVPQSLAIAMRDGLDANVQVFELPGRSFAGKVARSSGALLSSSRTLAVEVDVNNSAHILRAGLFVNVSFAIPREHPNAVIPAEALIFNQGGLRVALINDDKSIHLQPVTVYRDSGATLELSDGLRGGENIVLNPPTSLREGGRVKVATDQKIAEALKQ